MAFGLSRNRAVTFESLTYCLVVVLLIIVMHEFVNMSYSPVVTVV